DGYREFQHIQPPATNPNASLLEDLLNIAESWLAETQGQCYRSSYSSRGNTRRTKGKSPELERVVGREPEMSRWHWQSRRSGETQRRERKRYSGKALVRWVVNRTCRTHL